MADLRLSVSELLKRVGDFVGDTNNEVPTGDALTLAQDIVARGLRRFLYPVDIRTGEGHDWSFLKQFYVITLVSGQWQYPLPTNFSELLTNPVYGDEDGLIHLDKVPPEMLMDMRVGLLSSTPPSFFAVVPYGAGATTGTFDEMWFYPIPDSDYQIKFWYRLDPLKPSAISEILPGGPKAAEAIIETCLSVAEQQENDKIGLHTQIAEKLVQQLITIDSGRDNETRLGNLYTGGLPVGNQYRNITTTWYPDE